MQPLYTYKAFWRRLLARPCTCATAFLLLSAFFLGLHRGHSGWNRDLLSKVRSDTGRLVAGALRSERHATSQDHLYTTHECTGLPPYGQRCTFKNLWMRDGHLHFVAEEDPNTVQIPRPSVTDNPHKPWANLEIQATRPLSWHTQGDGVTTIKEALLVFRASSHDHLYHTIADDAALVHDLLCRQLGRCDNQPATGVQIIFIDDTQLPQMQAVKELWRCLSTEAPVSLVRNASTPFRISKAVVGIGPFCLGFLWCESDLFEVPRAPWPRDEVTAYKGRLEQCALPAAELKEAAARAQSWHKVVLINRVEGSGRTLLNSKEVVRFIQGSWPESNVTEHLLKGKSLREQALLYHQADVIIAVHGGSFGNVFFMRNGSCIIEVQPHGFNMFPGNDSPLFYTTGIMRALKLSTGIHHLVYKTSDANHTILSNEALARVEAELQSKFTKQQALMLQQHAVCDMSGAEFARCSRSAMLQADLTTNTTAFLPVLQHAAALVWCPVEAFHALYPAMYDYSNINSGKAVGWPSDCSIGFSVSRALAV